MTVRIVGNKEIGINHLGVITEYRGQTPIVTSATKKERRVMSETFEEFVGEHEYEVYPPESRAQAERRIKKVLQEYGKPYDLLNRNCEHVIFGRSPQLEKAAKGIFVLAVAFGIGSMLAE